MARAPGDDNVTSDIMATRGSKRVTFTDSPRDRRDSDHDSDGGWDNPFQSRDLTDDAEMILTLWRSGSLHCYPAPSPLGAIRNVFVCLYSDLSDFFTRVDFILNFKAKV